MLCIFPFEADLYHESGLRTVFVGHPMIERLRDKKIDIQRDPNLVGLFPGSRRREIRKIFPVLIKTAALLRETNPDLRFEVAAASAELATEMQQMLQPGDPARIEIKPGRTAEIMQRSTVGIVASGSATLEAAFFRLPFVLIYKVSWPTYLAGRLLVKVNYLGMPNVLADKQVVPEFIQQRARPDEVGPAVLRLLDDPNARQQMLWEFDKIAALLGESGASERAAREILSYRPPQRCFTAGFE
jgi:lipid-A-disaccharide synthase